MAAGDAQKKWFPEVINQLKTEWRPSIEAKELVVLCEAINVTLMTIRTERNILPPMFTCPKCKTTERSKPQKISVQAILITAERLKLDDKNNISALYKNWMKFRKKNNLDLYGHTNDRI